MKNNYIQGMKAGIPVILGFIPVGIAFGVMARQANFTILQTCLTSLTVFAGASQMLAVSMTLEGATILAIILATFILNLRHLIMSTVVMNKMEGRTSLKLIAAFGVTDESFAIFSETSKEKSKNVTLQLQVINSCPIFYFLFFRHARAVRTPSHAAETIPPAAPAPSPER